MKYLRNTVLALALVLGLSLVLTGTVNAQSAADQIRSGISATGSDGGNAEATVGQVIKTVINVLSYIVGIIAVIMIIVGGLKYITSSGDSGNVTSAKNTILYAIVGLVIVALAQVIVRFVVDKV